MDSMIFLSGRPGPAPRYSTSMPTIGTSEHALASRQPKYVYEPLSGERRIRLVDLQLYHHPTRTVVATLREMDLDQDLEFWALSYTWGYPLRRGWVPDLAMEASAEKEPLQKARLILVAPDHLFVVRGRHQEDYIDCTAPTFLKREGMFELDIGRNLGDFLWALYRQYVAGNVEEMPALWIDAICINQEDLAEKAAQVDLMGDIYSLATKTIIWLGPDMADSATVWMLHKQWLPAVKKEVRRRMQRSTEGYPPAMTEKEATIQFLRELQLKDPRDSMTWIGSLDAPDLCRDGWQYAWLTYFEFFAKRAWFHRSWVLQEAVLSANIQIAVGEQWDITWEELVELSRMVHFLRLQHTMLRTSWSFLRKSNKTMLEEQLFVGVLDIQQLKLNSAGASRENVTSLTLWHGLIYLAALNTRRREATFDVDRIYSIVGLVRRLAPKELQGFGVSYHTPARQLYIQFTRQLIERTKSLYPLRYVEGRFIDTVNLPSWVPDHSSSTGWGSDIHGSLKFQIEAREGAGKPPRVEGERLHVSAVRVGKMYLYGIRSLDKVEIKDICMYTHIMKAMSDVYQLTGQTRLEATWRTSIMDRSGSIQETPANPRLALGFRYWMLEGLASKLQALDAWEATHPDASAAAAPFSQRLKADLDDMKLDPEGFPTMEEIRERAARTKAHIDAENFDDPIIREYFEQHMATVGGRNLFLTAEGLIGVGPILGKHVDEIWLAEGGDVPYVLRPQKDGIYLFVGPCYVHGGMNGELATEERQQQLSEIVII